MNLQKQMRGGPDTLIFHIYAGHGVQQGGQQNLLVNEYDARTTFYKRFKAETIIRDFSMKMPNTYHVAIFACCRELERYEYSFVNAKDALKQHTELLKDLGPQGDDGEQALLKNDWKTAKGDQQNRGDVTRDEKVHQNFVMIFGTRPSAGVALDTKMIQNLTDNIKHKEHKTQFHVEFPTVLSSIRADDANFEIVVSNTCNLTNLYNKRSKFLPAFDKTITKIVGKACVQEAWYNDADEFDRERLHR